MQKYLKKKMYTTRLLQNKKGQDKVTKLKRNKRRRRRRRRRRSVGYDRCWETSREPVNAEKLQKPIVELKTQKDREKKKKEEEKRCHNGILSQGTKAMTIFSPSNLKSHFLFFSLSLSSCSSERS